MSNAFKFLCFCVIFVGLFSVVNKPVFAHVDGVGGNTEEIDALNKEIAARKEKIKQLEDTMATYKKNIEQKRLEAVSLKNQTSILENRIAQAETDIILTEERISELGLEIRSLEIAMEDKQSAIDRQKAIITKIIQNLHANDQQNIVEILLTNDSFAEFYNQAKYLENVYADLGRSVKSFRLAREDLSIKKAALDEKKIKLVELKSQLVNKKSDYSDQVNVKKNLYAKTQASEAKFQTLLDSLRNQYQVIEGEVRSYEDQVRKKMAELDRFKGLNTDLVLSWPVPSRYITCPFHDPNYPYKHVFEHSAIDIRASQGTAIKAAAPGYIARAKRCTTSACYSYVLIIHTSSISTLYGHMSSISVKDDQFVDRGDIIGYSGGTPGTVGAGPFVTGPHLHFEVRQNGIPVDPMGYLLQ